MAHSQSFTFVLSKSHTIRQVSIATFQSRLSSVRSVLVIMHQISRRFINSRHDFHWLHLKLHIRCHLSVNCPFLTRWQIMMAQYRRLKPDMEHEIRMVADTAIYLSKPCISSIMAIGTENLRLVFQSHFYRRGVLWQIVATYSAQSIACSSF
jgi:hypothetical protein